VRLFFDGPLWLSGPSCLQGKQRRYQDTMTLLNADERPRNEWLAKSATRNRQRSAAQCGVIAARAQNRCQHQCHFRMPMLDKSFH
jgi:hypothetical protein